MKAIFVFMLIVLALLLCSSDASALGLRGKQVVRQKTVIRGGAARGIGGGVAVQQSTVIGGGAVAQRTFVRQRSLSTMNAYAVAAQASYAQAVYAPVIQAQVLAAPVIYQAPVVQQAVVQQQVYAAPVLQQATVVQTPVYAPVQFDVAPACVAPAAIVRQGTIYRGY